jgi:hypothetical protein
MMHGREVFGLLPNLSTLNEDNKVADKAKFKRKAFKRNDPSNTMNCPPFFRVFCDGYGGQQSAAVSWRGIVRRGYSGLLVCLLLHWVH